MSKHPRSFHVVAKPIGSQCNLDCTYCYYNYKQNSRISDALLERFIEQYISGQEEDPVVFNWHGGEPAILGLDFFRRVIELEQKYANGHRIDNDFQTNGTLLDDDWCEFFQQNNFYVGLSIDGPKHLHDHYRTGFDETYRAAKLLQKHGVDFNPLTVINRVTAKHPNEVYKFLTQDLGCCRLQWLPCVGHKDFQTTAPGYWEYMPIVGTPEVRSVVTDWSVDPDDWGDFLCQTFYLWTKDIGKVLVNWFESLVGQWMGKRAQICNLSPVCGRSLVTMEADGSLYSCDHFVYPEHKIGHIDDGLADIVYSDKQRQFGMNKQSLPQYCKSCKYNFACNGECPKNRFLRTPDGEPGLNYLCSGNRKFFEYAEPYFKKIVMQLHGAGTTMTVAP